MAVPGPRDRAPARGWATAYSAAWPWSVALFIPLALLSFPDARPPRLIVPVVVGNAVLQVLLFSSDPDPLGTVAELDPARRQVTSYLALRAARRPSTSPPRSC